MLVEALVPESAVERFDVSVLVGLAGLDQAQGDAATVRPGPRVGVSGAGGDGTAYPWRFWLDGEPTVSAYRVARTRNGRAG